MKVKKRFKEILNSIEENFKLLSDYGFDIDEYINYFGCSDEIEDDYIEPDEIFNGFNEYNKFLSEYELILSNEKVFQLINEYIKHIDNIDKETIDKYVNNIIKGLNDIKNSDFLLWMRRQSLLALFMM